MCVCDNMYACACVNFCVCVYLCLYTYGGICACMRTCVYMRVRACTYICVCVCTYASACMSACAQMCLRTFILTTSRQVRNVLATLTPDKDKIYTLQTLRPTTKTHDISNRVNYAILAYIHPYDIKTGEERVSHPHS